MAESGESASDLLVIFGITGDLARKMTFQALYRLEHRGLLQCPIVGVASEDISVEELVKRARKAIEGAGEKLDDKVLRFISHLQEATHGGARIPNHPSMTKFWYLKNNFTNCHPNTFFSNTH